MQVAKTILEQLGGGRFVAMTGAKDFIGSTDTLRFSLRRGSAKNGATLVAITLTPADLYDVRFGRIGRTNGSPAWVTVDEVDGVYADQLRDIFTRATGLYTSL